MSITTGFEDNKCFVKYGVEPLVTPTAYYIPYDVDQLLAHARALEEMLRKHEWADYDRDYMTFSCPECSSEQKDGHSPDCQLAKLLE